MSNAASTGYLSSTGELDQLFNMFDVDAGALTASPQSMETARSASSCLLLGARLLPVKAALSGGGKTCVKPADGDDGADTHDALRSRHSDESFDLINCFHSDAATICLPRLFAASSLRFLMTNPTSTKTVTPPIAIRTEAQTGNELEASEVLAATDGLVAVGAGEGNGAG